MHRTQLIVLGLTLSCLLLGDALLAWTPPAGNPTANNVAAPLHTGDAEQLKDGPIGVGGLSVFGNAYIQGASTTEVFDQAVTLEVEGKIGADAYCDEYGQNCVNTLGQLVTGGQDYSDSLVAGWPDMILCNTYSDPNIGPNRLVTRDAVLHRDNLTVSNNTMRYGGIQFRIDGTWISGGGAAGEGSCAGKTMNQLSAEGRTFAYNASPFTFASNIRYIVGGHALTRTLQEAGVPGIAYWNVSSIGHRNAEMAWVCNYFYPGSVPVGSVAGAYSSPSDNGIHLLLASGQWQRYGAGAYNSRIDGLYCRLP